MLGAMNLLAAILPPPAAQVPLYSDGIVPASLSPGKQQLQRHYLEPGQGPDKRCCASTLLEESQVSVPYPCQRAVPVSASCWLVIPP